PAPNTSSPPAPGSRLHALVAARCPEEARPRPSDVTPNSHCDRTVGPSPPGRSRNVAPALRAANPLPRHSLVPTNAANGLAPEPGLRSSARPPPRPCLDRVVGEPRLVCNRQGADRDRCALSERYSGLIVWVYVGDSTSDVESWSGQSSGAEKAAV